MDPAAYDAYLKGRHEVEVLARDAMVRARDHFEAAVRLDPGFAAAHAWLSMAQMTLGQQWGVIEYHEAMRLARASVQRALELDPQLPEAHTFLGWVKFLYDWDWEAAERAFRRAVELDPSSTRAHQDLGGYLLAMGRADEAVPHVELALDLDPLSLLTRTFACQYLVDEGLFEQGMRECRRVLELDPGYARARTWLARGYEGLGRFDEAIETWALDSTAATLTRVEQLREAYDARGGEGYWAVWASSTNPPGWFHAVALAQLGRADDLLAVLEEWYDQRGSWIAFLRMWYFDPVRDEPGFQAFLERVGLN